MTKITSQDFGSVSELAECALQHPRSVYSADPDWYGCATLREAVRVAESGWSEPRSDVLAITGDIMATLRHTISDTFQPVYDVTGATVDIGAFLEGIPECMIDFRPQEVASHGRVVTILFSCSVTAQHSADSIRRRGAVIGALIEILAQLQHSVILYTERATESYKRGQGVLSQLTKVKDAGDLFDIDAFMFAIGHPAMLRHLCFSAGQAVGFSPDDCSSVELTRANEVGADVVIDVNAGRNISTMLSDPVGFIVDTLRSLGIAVD
jgi:hypothetical protein